MWYQRTQKLKMITIFKTKLPLRKFTTELNVSTFLVEKYIRQRATGNVTKNTYIPDILWVIEMSAEMGKLIFLRSI